MRLFFVGFFMTGLVLIGLGARDRREASAYGEVIAPVITCEDGTPAPQPTKPAKK
jgi:hypothetical protein